MDTQGSTGSERRPYALRLRHLEDPRVRDAVAARVAAALPGTEASALAQALAGSGFAASLDLDDQTAAALLRDLYATGLPPAAVA